MLPQKYRTAMDPQIQCKDWKDSQKLARECNDPHATAFTCETFSAELRRFVKFLVGSVITLRMSWTTLILAKDPHPSELSGIQLCSKHAFMWRNTYPELACTDLLLKKMTVGYRGPPRAYSFIAKSTLYIMPSTNYISFMSCSYWAAAGASPRWAGGAIRRPTAEC